LSVESARKFGAQVPRENAKISEVKEYQAQVYFTAQSNDVKKPLKDMRATRNQEQEIKGKAWPSEG